MKKCFAVSYNGHLYFRSGSIYKHRAKEDRSESVMVANEFVKVIFSGDSYLYLEYNMSNKWASGIALNVNPAIYVSTFNMKGLVWDLNNKEFNVFKSVKDFNHFLEVNQASHLKIKHISKRKPYIPYVRKVLDILK